MPEAVQAIIDFFVDLFAALSQFLTAIGSSFGGIDIEGIIGSLTTTAPQEQNPQE